MNAMIERANRIDQISECHPWISTKDLRLILHHTYMRYAEKHSGQQLQIYLDRWANMACSISQHEMKNFIARVKEFAVFEP